MVCSPGLGVQGAVCALALEVQGALRQLVLDGALSIAESLLLWQMGLETPREPWVHQ